MYITCTSIALSDLASQPLQSKHWITLRHVSCTLKHVSWLTNWCNIVTRLHIYWMCIHGWHNLEWWKWRIWWCRHTRHSITCTHQIATIWRWHVIGRHWWESTVVAHPWIRRHVVYRCVVRWRPISWTWIRNNLRTKRCWSSCNQRWRIFSVIYRLLFLFLGSTLTSWGWFLACITRNVISN